MTNDEHRRGGPSVDLLQVERRRSSTTDPVTGRPNLPGITPSCVAGMGEDQVLTVVAAATGPRTLDALPGRGDGLDDAERLLADQLDLWGAGLPGSVVSPVDGTAVYLARTTHAEARTLRAHLPLLVEQLDRGAGRSPLLAEAQGAAAESPAVVTRALSRLALPQGRLPQPHTEATTVARTPLFDAWTGTRVASQVRHHPSTVGPRDAPRVEQLLSITRPVPFLDTARAVMAATARLTDPLRGHGPLLWDATCVLAAAGPQRAPLAELLVEHCPAHVWVGVAASLLDGPPDVLEALTLLRARGSTIVLTGYGSGRETPEALDELPVDAVVVDPWLERGATSTSGDRAAHWAVLEHARRHGVTALSHTRATAALMQQAPVDAEDVPWSVGGVDVAALALVSDARTAGLSLRETTVLVNGAGRRTPAGRRWSRYDVARVWASFA
ncbi:EAL domain-containing protein [Cellulomonas oligotrophica]|uniref:Uncharacterized protein n=1 Tax=Cellulomonas oligotrophica TaxID=931536 RepID=A0A7Y9FI18_9CELL|nr:EAL domain-containing protein [Cellulomonas oligotrophica]NYD87307.1 hypothetical protein [Cellulomonas oligotrophica]GIG34225.1 hypothetical protein Col01nite_33840 [Cellulomonas oligotrophica]